MPLTKAQIRESDERRAIVSRVAWFEKNFDAVLLTSAIGYSVPTLLNCWIESGCKVWDFCRFLTAEDQARLLKFLFTENL